MTVYEFGYRLPPEAKKVDITLALPRFRVVEFTARPSQVLLRSP